MAEAVRSRRTGVRSAVWYLTLAAVLLSGVMAGVFLTFSTFVMNGLSRLPASQGIAAMQQINAAVIGSAFLVVFLATSALCAALVVTSMFRSGNAGSSYVAAAGLVYFVGAFLVTAFVNIPLNDALANVVGKDASSVTFWQRYLGTWTAWNHVRMVSSLLATYGFVLGLIRL